jgi:signal peptidase I
MDDNERVLPEEDPEQKDTEKGTSVRGEIYDWLLCVVTAIIACVLVFTFVVRLVGVIGTSMVPTLHEGDYVVTSNLFYKPKQGDVVILRKKVFDDRAIVKRVIAVGGQTVDIDFDAGVVYVDGQALEEDYVNAPTYRELDFKGEITVPENCVFVLGDNRNESLDSRRSALGCVDTRYIIGRGYLVLLPLRDIKLLT